MVDLTPTGPGALPGHPDKPGLRATLRDARTAHVAALGRAGVETAARQAATNLLPHLPLDAIIGLYLSIGDELDPAPLIDLLTARGQPLALPHLADRTDMYFRSWAPGDDLERGPFKLRQPLATAAEVAPTYIVTPLVGFTRDGARIGQGASHYDRAFARFPGARRIGYAWSVQEAPALPHDPWDVPLHAIVTEEEWIPVA